MNPTPSMQSDAISEILFAGVGAIAGAVVGRCIGGMLIQELGAGGFGAGAAAAGIMLGGVLGGGFAWHHRRQAAAFFRAHPEMEEQLMQTVAAAYEGGCPHGLEQEALPLS